MPDGGILDTEELKTNYGAGKTEPQYYKSNVPITSNSKPVYTEQDLQYRIKEALEEHYNAVAHKQQEQQKERRLQEIEQRLSGIEQAFFALSDIIEQTKRSKYANMNTADTGCLQTTGFDYDRKSPY